MRWLLVSLLVLMVSLSLAEVVVVEGYGSTLQEAKDDAMRNALEQVVGAYVKSVTYVQDYSQVKDSVYSAVRGYVRIVSILQQRKESDETGEYYYVKAKVEVVKGKVEDRLKELLSEVGEPTVGVMIAEKFSSRYSSCDYPFQPEFFEKFGFKGLLADRGLKVQDIGALSEFNKKLQQEGVGQEDLVKISDVAKDIASYVVAVKVDYVSRPVYGVCSVSARAEVKVVRTDTAKAFSLSFNDVIAKATPEAAIEWLLKSPRSKMYIKKIADEIAMKIYAHRANYAFNPKNIRVRFELPNMEWMKAISDLMENIPEAINVTKQYVAGKTIIFAVKTYHTPYYFYDVMKEALKDSVDMDLVSVSGDTITVKVSSIFAPVQKEVVLKFQIDKLVTGIKIKKCLEKMNGVKLLGVVERGKTMYAFKVESDMSPEDLAIAIEEMECRGVEISLEDMADDGSWILFSAK